MTIPHWLQQDITDDHFAKAKPWLKEFREQHWQAFLQQGLPTRHNENWKYSDTSFLLEQQYVSAKKMDVSQLVDAVNQHRLRSGDALLMVLVNGYFMPELSDIAKLPANVIACSISEALEKHTDSVKAYLAVDKQNYPFANLNAAMFVDGLFLQLQDHCEISSPIHLLSLVASEAGCVAHTRNMIVLGENSHLTLVEEYFSHEDVGYMMNVVTTIHAGKSAKLQHYKIQKESKKAVHIASHFVQQQQHSYVSHVNFSAGAQFARDDVSVQLLAPGAECHTSGFYHLRYANQLIDNHVDIQHAAPHSNSDMLYKGIMENKSRAVFNGRLHVKKDAQKIVAFQANHNLLLSKEAEVYSKPELEIYADDVKCKHGATTGQLDTEALFYLRSRGIAREDAVNMLLRGFSEEIMQRITHEGIRLRVKESI